MNRETWRAALAEHSKQGLEEHPLPARATLSAADDMRCQITGDTLLDWLRKYGPPMLQEREVLRDSFEVETDPAIVFISTIPGLVAGLQILGVKQERVFFSTPERFASFLKRYPDDTNRWHVTYECYFFTPEEPKDLALAKQKYPLQPGEEYWLHREVSTLAPLFVRGGEHLWKWDGKTPVLLEEAFTSYFA